MLSRSKKGKLILQMLDLEIFFNNLFVKCNTEEEIEWLNEQLESILNINYEKSLEKLEVGNS